MHWPELIDWSLQKHKKGLYQLSKHFNQFEPDFFKLLEIFAQIELSRSNNIVGIQEKIKEETSSFDRFLSFGSELVFANEFVFKGFGVELYVGNEAMWEQPNSSSIPTPDLSVDLRVMKMFTEVARVSGDETTSDIAALINPTIRELGFRVDIIYSERFSIPVISSSERTNREKLVSEFVEKFYEVIDSIEKSSLPQTIDFLDCKVTFTKPLKGKEGYYAGDNTAAIIVPTENILKQIKKVILSKAIKRKKWPSSLQNEPYLIALDVHQTFLLKEDLDSLLYGKRTFFQDCEPVYSEPPLVQAAKQNGWAEFLEKVGFSQNEKCPVTEVGLFITSEQVCRNISGIFIRLHCLASITLSGLATIMMAG
ncbi:MAG: hypothetical protein V3U75_05265 [Methylococcaceae bacterium]